MYSTVYIYMYFNIYIYIIVLYGNPCIVVN